MENIQAENATLRTEIENLAGKLKQREMEAREFREKYDELVQRNEQFAQPLSHDNKEHNERIDALVREIDDCISRLK
ncbi:MAG: hypothetical protein R3277_04155 [Brumimicrobium sp.]|nr:hypothetical protein [Brumimicrobium sp.]